MMAADCVFLKSCLRAAEALESLVKPSYGPNGLDSLILSHSGDALMTSDGATVLSSVDVKHPSGKMILDAVLTHHGRHGDNSKSFLLMVTEALRNILYHVETAQEASKLGRHLMASHKHILDSLVLPSLIQFSRHTKLSDRSDFQQTASYILKTHLSGKFAPSVTDILTSLLLDFVDFPPSGGDGTDTNASEHIAWLIDLFPCCCSTIDGLSVRQSRVADGIVINREIQCGGDNYNWPGGYFIILEGDFSFPIPESAESLKLVTSSMSDATQWQFQYSSRLATTLKCQGVTLLVVTGNCAKSCIQTLVEHGIAVVTMVAEEDAKLIAEHLCVDICSFTDLVAVPPGAFCEYVSAEWLVVGKENCVNIKGVRMKHLIVCAPTQALAKIYYISLHNALKCLRMWTQSLSKSATAMAVPGGGKAELLVDCVLTELISDKEIAQDYVDAAALLQKAVRSIPRALIDNSHIGGNGGRALLIAISQAQTMVSQSVCPSGMDQVSDDDADGVGVWEPLYSKYSLLQSVVNLLGQITRIETVVSVRHLPGLMAHQ